MSDIVTLRKLTEKSTLKFGQYHDIPIYNLLDLQRNTYLRWVYYNSSNITFMDNILFKIGILENELINKPGKNTEMYDLVTNRIRSKMSDKLIKKTDKIREKNFKAQLVQEHKNEGILFSKSALTNRNHGK